MSLEDKLAIQETIARYSYAYDSRDAEAFAALFLEDGVFEVLVPNERDPAVRLLSRAAIRDWAAQRHQLSAGHQARHYQSNILFEKLTTNTASTRTMLLLTRQEALDRPPIVVLTGVYRDEWRKSRHSWRLARRAAYVDRDPGFARQLL